MTFVSHASNLEDVLLNRAFHGLDAGFYIDVGADHPIAYSTTYSFYERGWCGVNIEPGPNFDLCAAERPRDVNLRAVVSDFCGETDFFVHDEMPATSSVQQTLHPRLDGRISRRTLTRVPAMTLNAIVTKYSIDRLVNFLKIDAEGSEESIILATDWKRFRPQIIVAEATEPFSNVRIDGSWGRHLSRNGFLEVYFDGINTWFVREESKELAEHFQVPINALDAFTVFDPQIQLMKAHIGELESELKSITDAREAMRQLQSHLTWPGAPRSIRAVLPLARLLRAVAWRLPRRQ